MSGCLLSHYSPLSVLEKLAEIKIKIINKLEYQNQGYSYSKITLFTKVSELELYQRALFTRLS